MVFAASVGQRKRDDSPSYNFVSRPSATAKRAPPEGYFMYKPSECTRDIYLLPRLCDVHYTPHATCVHTATLLMMVREPTQTTREKTLSSRIMRCTTLKYNIL